MWCDTGVISLCHCHWVPVVCLLLELGNATFICSHWNNFIMLVTVIHCFDVNQITLLLPNPRNNQTAQRHLTHWKAAKYYYLCCDFCDILRIEFRFYLHLAITSLKAVHNVAVLLSMNVQEYVASLLWIVTPWERERRNESMLLGLFGVELLSYRLQVYNM